MHNKIIYISKPRHEYFFRVIRQRKELHVKWQKICKENLSETRTRKFLSMNVSCFWNLFIFHKIYFKYIYIYMKEYLPMKNLSKLNFFNNDRILCVVYINCYFKIYNFSSGRCLTWYSQKINLLKNINLF